MAQPGTIQDPQPAPATKQSAVTKLRDGLRKNFTAFASSADKKATKATATLKKASDAVVAFKIADEMANKKIQIKEGFRHLKVQHSVTDFARDEQGRALSWDLVLTELHGIEQHLHMRATMVGALGTHLGKVAELEMIRDTDHGKRIITAQSTVRALGTDIARWQKRTLAVKDRYHGQDPSDAGAEDALRLHVTRHRVEVMGVVAALNESLYEVQSICAHAIEYESMKAIVTDEDSDYTTAQKRVEVALIVVDQGIGAVDEAVTLVGSVPDPYAEAAAMGAHVAVSIFKAMRVVFGRTAMSMAVTADVKDFNRTEAIGSHLQIHQEDPLKIARMLGRKRVRDVEYVLDLVAEPVIAELNDLCPVPMVVAESWTLARASILAAVNAYQDERVSRAQKALDALQGLPDDPVGIADTLVQAGLDLGKDFLETIADDIKSSVFTALNPLKLITDAAIKTLANKVAAMIVSALPVNPAQVVDGSALRTALDGIVNNLHVVVQIEKQVAVVSGSTCPTVTSSGTAVSLVLSAMQGGGDAGPAYWTVMLGDDDETVGDLDETGDFTADDDQETATADLPPRQDSRGVVMTSVEVPGAPGGADGETRRFVARVGRVRGALVERAGEAEPWTFVPDPESPIDPAAFRNWSTRFIRPNSTGRHKAGYSDRVTNQHVEGTWYQPVAGRFWFVFVSTAGTVEWALGAANTDNSPNTRLLEVMRGHVQHTPETDLATSAMLMRLR